MYRSRYPWVMAALLAGLGLWPLHGLAEKGFGDFSAPPAPVPKARPKPSPKPKPKPQSRPQPSNRVESRVEPGPKPVAGPAPSIGAMVRIPAGCFQMGSPEGEPGRNADERLHRVCVQAFELGRYEVTVGEFQRFVSATGYRTDAERNVGGKVGCRAYDAYEVDEMGRHWAYRAWADWRRPNRDEQNQDDHPVSCVSLNDAMAYADWLNRASGRGWRLPTEAEWEYAARAGTQTPQYWEDGETAACRYANVPGSRYWASGFPCDDGYHWVAPVGHFEANAWGLKDMLGNVVEWTCSVYDEDYGDAERECPRKQNASRERALRGGSWVSEPGFVRAAGRHRFPPDGRAYDLGIRLARTLTP